MEFKSFSIGIIVGAILLLLLNINCGKIKETEGKEIFITKSDTIKIHDTLVHTKTINHWHPKSITIVEIPSIVDTQLILQKYFTKNYYEKTWNDGTLVATMKDTIFENKIKYAGFDYKLLKPTLIIKDSVFITKECIKKMNLLIGGELDFNKTQVNIAPILALQFKDKNQIFIGYSVPNNCYKIGALFNLKK